jgi:hypothetical protein
MKERLHCAGRFWRRVGEIEKMGTRLKGGERLTEVCPFPRPKGLATPTIQSGKQDFTTAKPSKLFLLNKDNLSFQRLSATLLTKSNNKGQRAAEA